MFKSRPLGLLRTLALSLGLIAPGLSQATDCPHVADYVLYKEQVNGRVLLKKGSYVNFEGAIPITTWIRYYTGGDSCILTFERWGYSRYIGGGLTLTWRPAVYLGRYGYTDYWPGWRLDTPCGQIWPDTNFNSYRWGGRISSTAVGYETWGCWGGDTISLRFYITGVYDGSILQLKPQSGVEYRMASGESSRRFNPYNPFPANGSGQAPVVIKSSDPGCGTRSESTTPSNRFTTYARLPGNAPQTLGTLSSVQTFTNCTFYDGDTVSFRPRHGWGSQIISGALYPNYNESDPWKLINSVKIDGNTWQDTYSFSCTTCQPVQTENIQAVITRRLNAWNLWGQSCGAQISFSTGPVGGGQINASNMTACDSMQVSTELRFVQTAALVNPIITSPDPNNLTTLHPFTANNLGVFEVRFNRPTWEPKSFSFFVNPNGANLVAPFVEGCNVLETSYPTVPPDFITARDMIQASSVQELSNFSSQTRMRLCTLKSTDVVTAAPLNLDPANAGATNPLEWVSSSTSGNQTVIDEYRLRCTKCAPVGGKNAPAENLVFRITRVARAWSSSNSPLCQPVYSNANRSLRMSNPGYCDNFSIDTKVEVIQKGVILNSEPYTFANPLASHVVSVPMIGTVSTAAYPITNKAFAVRPAPPTSCRVVLRSSTQKK